MKSRLIGILKPGDILFYHGQSKVSRLIRWGIKSHWSHAALYAGAAWGQHFVFEAALEGVRAFPLYPKNIGLVLRAPNINYTKLLSVAARRLGAVYDFPAYPKLALYALKLHYPWLPIKVSRHKQDALFYCFEYVAWSFDETGYFLYKGVHDQLGWPLPYIFMDAAENGLLQPVYGSIKPNP